MGGEKFAAAWSRVAGLWMQYTGRIVILAMFVIALLAAIYAQWYLYFGSRKALEYYGPDASTIIQDSSDIELFHLVPASPETKAQRLAELKIQNRPYAIKKLLHIAKAPGAIHARTALLADANYRWETPATAAVPQWEYAIQFREVKSVAIVAFSPSSGQAILVGKNTAVSITPIAQAMEEFRQGAEAQAAAHQAGLKSNRALRSAM